jgi:anti-sigma regulatory factor (Ser/Thr protein kinase)
MYDVPARNDFYSKEYGELLEAGSYLVDVIAPDNAESYYCIRRLSETAVLIFFEEPGPAVHLTATVNTTVDRLLREKGVESLTSLVEAVHSEVEKPEAMQACFVIIDRERMIMEYSSYAMPDILVVNGDESLIRLKANNAAFDQGLAELNSESIVMENVEKILFTNTRQMVTQQVEAAFQKSCFYHEFAEAVILDQRDSLFIYLRDTGFEKELVAEDRIMAQAGVLGDAEHWYEEQIGWITEVEDIRNRCSFAFSELLLNAYEHGSLGISGEQKHELMENDTYLDVLEAKEAECSKQISIALYRFQCHGKDYLMNVISDEGDGFDTEVLHTTGANDRYQGRGVLMSRQHAWELYYNEKGNSVLTIFQLTHHTEGRSS